MEATQTLKLRIKDKHAKAMLEMARDVNMVASGDRFGMLIAVRRFEGPGKRKWVCLCDCGKEAIAEETKLRLLHKKSCGCLRLIGQHLSRMTAAATVANRKVIAGARFGRLLVITESEDGTVTCACDCGTTVERPRRNLISGSTKSCGCLHRDHGLAVAEKRAKDQRTRAGLPDDVPMSPHSKTLRNQFREVSAHAKKRDDYTCALCGDRGVRLNVHHIERWSDSPDLRFDETNLVTLCRRCHVDKAHGGNVHREPDPVIAEILKTYVLKQREWTCGDCGTVHDRDVNAARNILRLGHQALAGGIPVKRDRKDAKNHTSPRQPA